MACVAWNPTCFETELCIVGCMPICCNEAIKKMGTKNALPYIIILFFHISCRGVHGQHVRDYFVR
jgi:hypothetical protein